MVNCILFKGIVYKIQNCENEPRFPWPKGFPTLTCSLFLKGHEDVISSDSVKKKKEEHVGFTRVPFKPSLGKKDILLSKSWSLSILISLRRYYPHGYSDVRLKGTLVNHTCHYF